MSAPGAGPASDRPAAGPASDRPAADDAARGADGTPVTPRPGWSLRARLTLLTAGLLAVALAAGALALTAALRAGRVAALDDIARERATTLAALVTEDRLPPALPVAEPGEVAQLLDAAGRVLATSTNASRTLPAVPADRLTALRAEAGDGVLVTGTTDGAYDDAARVAVVAATYRGEPVTVVVAVPLSEVQELLAALRVALVGVVPVLTGLLALAIWLVLGRALHPVEQLRSAAAQVASTGGGGSLPVPRADDELGALARTLNAMLDRLEEASARQRAFVADAAHELRSPLAALGASVDVARRHPDAYRADELAAELAGEVHRMQDLVEDLLLLARVGAVPVRRDPVDLRAVADAAVEAALAARTADGGADGSGSGADVRVTGAGAAVGDAAALARVVRNLVDNALRHARAHVEVAVGDGRVVVDDDGAGLAAADRERVFERFVRLDDAREREAGGSGLGLAISREIARDHGGDVTLAAGPRGGVAATVTLPRGAAQG